MSRAAWDTIKKSKRFYINTYRKAGSFLLFSLVFNVLLGLAIFYVYFNRPEPDYYATYGGTAPVQLTAMGSANDTSEPLLPDDSIDDEGIKVVPQ